LALICETEVIGTRDFWEKYKERLPNLYELFEKLIHIPASSSFIEEYFSLAGYAEGPTRPNTSEDLLIARALIKANKFILDCV
jgi:hypothetical protein